MSKKKPASQDSPVRGRPKTRETAAVQICATFEPEVAEAIDAEAARLSAAAGGATISRAEAMRQLVKRGLGMG